MKRFLSITAAFFFCLLGVAQGGGLNFDSLMNDMPDVGDNFYISVVVDENEQYPIDAVKLLKSNLGNVVSRNGFLDTDGASPFFVAMNYVVLAKDVVPGMPIRISQNVQFNFVIGDAKENKVFSTYACTVRGVGTNEQKAILAAIRRIPWNDDTFRQFIEEGKQRIIDYYAQRVPQIIEEARLLERQGNFEQAIAMLTTIPKACTQHRDCMRMALEVYQNMIDHIAQNWLTKARNTWTASPDKHGAEQAIALIDSIPSDSRYETDVDSLLAEIKTRVKEIDNQEWQMKMEKIKAQNRSADRIQATQSGVFFSGLSTNSSGRSSLSEKWNAQPTWKKVLIAGGIGLAAATVGTGFLTAKVAGAILARTSFHVIKML